MMCMNGETTVSVNCKFCDSDKYQKILSLRNHERCCIKNPDRIPPGRPFKNGDTPWNKGLSKETDNRILIHSEIAKKNGSNKGVGGTPEKELQRRLKLQEHARKQGLGGRVKGSGSGKKGWYKGIWCDSSWELAFVCYHIDHGIPIKRCEECRYYSWEDKVYKYYPDFIVDSSIIEVKGYKSPQCESKLVSNPDVLVFGKEEMKPILSYIRKRYGTNFISMYMEDTKVGSLNGFENRSDP